MLKVRITLQAWCFQGALQSTSLKENHLTQEAKDYCIGYGIGLVAATVFIFVVKCLA